MKYRAENTAALIINAFIVLSVAVITVLGVSEGAGAGQVGEMMKGTGYFKAFTIDSNVLMGVCSFVMLVFNVNGAVNKKYEMPSWAVKTYLFGAGAVGLTFVTVVLFLAPTFKAAGMDMKLLFSKDMFFFHVAVPVLSVITLVFLTPAEKLKIRPRIFALAPTVIYSAVYTVNVAVLNKWPDFYSFTFGGKLFLIPVVIIVMYGASFGIITLISLAHNGAVKKREKTE